MRYLKVHRQNISAAQIPRSIIHGYTHQKHSILCFGFEQPDQTVNVIIMRTIMMIMMAANRPFLSQCSTHCSMYVLTYAASELKHLASKACTFGSEALSPQGHRANNFKLAADFLSKAVVADQELNNLTNEDTRRCILGYPF